MDIYIDITQFERGRANTGVQRVTREFMQRALQRTGSTFNLVVVTYDTPLKSLQVLSNDEVECFLQNTATYQFQSRETIDIEKVRPSKGAIFLDLDSAWNAPFQRHELYPILKKNGFQIFTFIHDLVPILLPQVVHKVTRMNFERYIQAVSEYTDMALFNSMSTESDFVRHKSSLEIDRYIARRVVGLGSDFHKSGPNDVDDQYQRLLGSKFILSVGTIEPRKSHEQLLDAFDVLSEKYPDLNLVLVGAHGWDIDALVHRINTHPLKDTRLFWLTGIDDSTLEAFYQNAFLVAYLSKYEGYGLPIAESLQFGNITITSKNSSMYEVGRECADYIEYGSLNEMVDIVSLYSDNAELYESKRDFIRSNFHAISWDTFSNSIFDIFSNLEKTDELKSKHLSRLQFVFISIDAKALQGTLSAIDEYVTFVKEIIVVTAPRFIPAFEGLSSRHKITVVNENDILGEYVEGFSSLDHQSKNWLLRTSLLNLEGLDDEFIMLDDDNRPLKPIDIDKFITADGKYNAYYFYSLLDWHHTNTEYDLGQHAVRNILTDKNYELLSYSSHCPQIINRSILAEVVSDFHALGLEQPLDEWSVYFNYLSSRYPFLVDKKFFETINWPQSPRYWNVDFVPENIAFENYYETTYQHGIFQPNSTLAEKVEAKKAQVEPFQNTIDIFKENVDVLRQNNMVHGVSRFAAGDVEVFLSNIPYYVVIQREANCRLRLNYKVINKLEKNVELELCVQLGGRTRNFRKFADIKGAAYFESIIEFPIISEKLSEGLFDITLNLKIDNELVFPEGSPFLIKMIVVNDKNYLAYLRDSKLTAGREGNWAESLRDKIRGIPVIGRVARWVNNLIRLNRLRHTVHVQQQQINTLLLYNRQHIDRYNALEKKIQSLQAAKDKDKDKDHT